MALILCHNVTPVTQKKKKKVKDSDNRPSGEESSLYSGNDEEQIEEFEKEF